MYKSFILSITISLLNSVAYGARTACDKNVMPICEAFCGKAVKDNNFAFCNKNPEVYNECNLTPRNQTEEVVFPCKDEIMTACTSFYEKVTKGSCLCRDGTTPKCQVF